MRARDTSHKRPGRLTDFLIVPEETAVGTRFTFARQLVSASEVNLVEHFSAVKPSFQQVHQKS